VNGQFNMSLPLDEAVPGDYKLLFFLEDGYEVGAIVPFTIASYADCGNL
jgi:hypothetical protein